MKKLITYLLCGVLALSCLCGCGQEKQGEEGSIVQETPAPGGADASADSGDTTLAEPTPEPTPEPTADPYEVRAQERREEMMNYVPGPMQDITSMELVSNMKIGWNLGNTLDATGGSGLSSETSWGAPETTQEMIDEVLAQGFNVIRIPITWQGHFGEGPDYTIDEEWLDRVQEVVDYAYYRGAYVIINMHHEDWHFPSEENKEQACAMIRALWTQIANRFIDYNERLIFEGLNEPRKKGTEWEWNGGDAEGQAVVNEFMQVFVDTVRATGGNNELRHLMICGYAASSSEGAMRAIEIPDDDKIIVSVHAYTPYDFALNTSGTSEWKYTFEIEQLMTKIKMIFINKGTPVIIGEFGALNKDNEQDRANWAKIYLMQATNNGIPCCWWDNSAFNGSGENFGLINRSKQTWPFPILLRALLDNAGVE